jgi:hypothetical protein
MKHDDFRLKRPESPSLVEADFDPHGGDLDAQSAWKTFGGKTLVEAYELFLTNPLHFQEDYMWMGARAFDYYFPVVDEHLRAANAEQEWEDHEVGILGSCLFFQLKVESQKPSIQTQREMAELAEFVLANLGNFVPSMKEQGRIRQEWLAVQAALEGGGGPVR